MTIELSSHVLSFNKKLFLSVISLFIAFAICFMAFQYRREKEYKIELLNTQLQNYNDRLNDFLRGRDTLNIQQLDDYVCEHTFEDLRVTLINKNGTVIYDNLEKDPSHFENHHNRQEIKDAPAAPPGAAPAARCVPPLPSPGQSRAVLCPLRCSPPGPGWPGRWPPALHPSVSGCPPWLPDPAGGQPGPGGSRGCRFHGTTAGPGSISRWPRAPRYIAS